jgi:hypothetical protein
MLRIILVAAGTVMVTVAEKTPSVAHGPEHVKVLVGIAFALPCLLALLAAHLVSRAAAARAAAAPQSGYAFGQRTRRR